MATPFPVFHDISTVPQIKKMKMKFMGKKGFLVEQDRQGLIGICIHHVRDT